MSCRRTCPGVARLPFHADAVPVFVFISPVNSRWRCNTGGPATDPLFCPSSSAHFFPPSCFPACKTLASTSIIKKPCSCVYLRLVQFLWFKFAVVLLLDVGKEKKLDGKRIQRACDVTWSSHCSTRDCVSLFRSLVVHDYYSNPLTEK